MRRGAPREVPGTAPAERPIRRMRRPVPGRVLIWAVRLTVALWLLLLMTAGVSTAMASGGGQPFSHAMILLQGAGG
ncbi:hypothetical protein [Histidinibacterium aquaticum]|uniref:hypothetical protein n=1 Tax=Histidinibacterium aquaticum TaxID=2613962 RepID=UPI00168B7AAD|nr:hypothetical protein [Histidinibacterium aquaticum]